jgi:transposase
LVAAELLKGRTVAIDATTLEANAAMRSIVRRDTGETYQEFLTRLAAESGIRTPTREALARLDRRRKKRTSNQDWQNPFDPDAKITKMKDGRTHLAHKAEHAIDLESGAMVAVTLHGADVGDTTSLVETVLTAADHVEAAHAESVASVALTELIADRGYHSNQTLLDVQALGVRAYIAEPDRGRRQWTTGPDAQQAVYGNRRRVRGARGKRLMRRRGEYVERSFAHMYETGGMRRTHLRGHPNILKRLLVHAGAFNLGILMRTVFGLGAPRRLQGRAVDVGALKIAFAALWEVLSAFTNAALRHPRTILRDSCRHSALAIS